MNKLATIILKHDTPDGCHHFDWMFAQNEPPVSDLITYRLDILPKSACVGSQLNIKRLADHRTKYLQYEGPISNNRGNVSKIAVGWYNLLIDNSFADKDINHLFNVIWDTGENQRWQIIYNAQKLIRLL